MKRSDADGPIPSTTEWLIDGEIRSFIKGVKSGAFTVREVVEAIGVSPSQVDALCREIPDEAVSIRIVASKRKKMLRLFLEGVERAGIDRGQLDAGIPFSLGAAS